MILNFIHFKGYRQHSCFRRLYKTNYLIEWLAISHGCLWQITNLGGKILANSVVIYGQNREIFRPPTYFRNQLWPSSRRCSLKGLKIYVLKYKILIKLFVLNCMFIWCLYGNTIQLEVVVCLLVCCCTKIKHQIGESESGSCTCVFELYIIGKEGFLSFWD
jgi:hypothetical protein